MGLHDARNGSLPTGPAMKAVTAMAAEGLALILAQK